MNDILPDLFELMSRWDVEVSAIPMFLRRKGATLSQSDRLGLLERRRVLRLAVLELREVMASMIVGYRGLIDGVVVIESTNEEECWARVGDAGTVEFKLCTHWSPTDNALAHSPD